MFIVQGDNGQLEGHVDVYDVNASTRSARIGMGLYGAPSLRRTLAVISLVDFVFRKLTLQRLQADVREGNKPVQTIAERFGFEQEGRLRLGAGDEDVLVYGLLYADFFRKWVRRYRLWLR